MRTHCCQNKTIGLPLYRQLNFVLPFLAISYRSAIHKLLKMDDLKTLTSLPGSGAEPESGTMLDSCLSPFYCWPPQFQ